VFVVQSIDFLASDKNMAELNVAKFILDSCFPFKKKFISAVGG